MAAKHGKQKQRIRKSAILGAVAATVTALTVGITTPTTSPTSNAAAGVFTTGPLFDLAGALGLNVEDLLPADIQALVNTLGLIENIPSDPLDLNDAINGVSFVPVVNSRSVLVVSIGLGSFAATQAYQALRSSAQGNTLPGFSALQPGPVILGRQLTNTTNLVLVLARNPSRPDGGLFARFATVAANFGVDAVTPPAGVPLTRSPEWTSTRRRST